MIDKLPPNDRPLPGPAIRDARDKHPAVTHAARKGPGPGPAATAATAPSPPSSPDIPPPSTGRIDPGIPTISPLDAAVTDARGEPLHLRHRMTVRRTHDDAGHRYELSGVAPGAAAARVVIEVKYTSVAGPSGTDRLEPAAVRFRGALLMEGAAWRMNEADRRVFRASCIACVGDGRAGEWVYRMVEHRLDRPADAASVSGSLLSRLGREERIALTCWTSNSIWRRLQEQAWQRDDVALGYTLGLVSALNALPTLTICDSNL